MLLLTNGVTTQEILNPDFYKVFNGLKFNETEQIAVNDLYNYNQLLQSKYQCQNLFLKSVPRSVGYTLTLAAFHRYLSTDSERLGFVLKPAHLRNNFMLWYSSKHRNENPELSMKRLRLDIVSLQYFQNQLRVRDLRQIMQQKKPIFRLFLLHYFTELLRRGMKNIVAHIIPNKAKPNNVSVVLSFSSVCGKPVAIEELALCLTDGLVILANCC